MSPCLNTRQAPSALNSVFQQLVQYNDNRIANVDSDLVFYETTWPQPSQSCLETLPGVVQVGVACFSIRLDSELMGLPHRWGLSLHLPAYCVWKKMSLFSACFLDCGGISADKVAQSLCWVCWALSTPGPVVCHQKSLLNIRVLSPSSVCVCAFRSGVSADTFQLHDDDDDGYVEWCWLIAED